MSEPFSLVVFAPVDIQKLQLALRAEILPVSTFSDWGNADFELDPAGIARADKITPADATLYLQDLREYALSDRGWHFSYDPHRESLTIICLLWSDNWVEIISSLNVLRQMILSCGNGQEGYILVHDFVFAGSEATQVVQFQSGVSQFFGSGDARVEPTLKHATQLAKPVLDSARAVFDGTLSPDSPGAQIIDQFEVLAMG